MKMKELRQRRGLTLVQVATQMGTSFQYVQAYESGKHDLGRMSARNFLKLCDILNCTPQELLEE